MNRLLLCLALALSACQSSDEASPESSASVAHSDIEAAQEESSGSVAAAGSPAPPPAPARSSPDAAPPATGDAAPDAPAPRVLIRTADLRLRVDDYEEARRNVTAVARRLDALIAGEAEQRLPYEVSNTVTLRVEAARFDTLMDALVELGEEVEERRVSVDDVTEQAVDLTSRLRARRAVEARYVAILDRAGSIEDVLAVEARLSETREAIEIAEGQLRGLRDRVALSTITLTLTERSSTGITSGPGFFSRLARAFGSGWDALLGLIVGLVALWPLVPLVALGVLAWRTFRRRFPKRDKTVV